MATSRSSKQIFNHWISTGVTLVDFNAPWCRPCRAQKPIVDALEKSYHGMAKVETLNIDENQDIAFKLGIQSIPTIIIYRDGREMNRFIGLQTAETLNNALRAAVNHAKRQPHSKKPNRR